mmetsp:Transcript_4557/g.6144  ORF Transcript_4557/g.6144 Transcript_4557/m.6144 type:complete len:242 (-) Transcript_4557:124-849(-)
MLLLNLSHLAHVWMMVNLCPSIFVEYMIFSYYGNYRTKHISHTVCISYQVLPVFRLYVTLYHFDYLCYFVYLPSQCGNYSTECQVNQGRISRIPLMKWTGNCSAASSQKRSLRCSLQISSAADLLLSLISWLTSTASFSTMRSTTPGPMCAFCMRMPTSCDRVSRMTAWRSLSTPAKRSLSSSIQLARTRNCSATSFQKRIRMQPLGDFNVQIRHLGRATCSTHSRLGVNNDVLRRDQASL